MILLAADLVVDHKVVMVVMPRVEEVDLEHHNQVEVVVEEMEVQEEHFRVDEEQLVVVEDIMVVEEEPPSQVVVLMVQVAEGQGILVV